MLRNYTPLHSAFYSMLCSTKTKLMFRKFFDPSGIDAKDRRSVLTNDQQTLWANHPTEKYNFYVRFKNEVLTGKA